MAREYERALGLLDASAPEFGAPAHPEFAWSLVRQLIRGQFEVLDGDRVEARWIVAAPDGRTLGWTDHLGGLWLWDLATGTFRSFPSEYPNPIGDLVFSPDGRRFAAASVTGTSGIFLGDVASGRRLGSMGGSVHWPLSALLFSKDGSRLAAFGARPVRCWDLSGAGGTFPFLSPEKDPTTVADWSDVRLRSLADLLDDRSPRPFDPLPELKRSWVERAPRGIARTQDHAMGLLAQGDGAFEVYSLESNLRLAIGLIHERGCALVFFENKDTRWKFRPAQRAALDRLGGMLVPRAMGEPLPPNVLVRLGLFDHAAAFSPDGRLLAIWTSDKKNSLKIVDLTTGLTGATLDIGPLTEPRGITFTADSATLVFGGLDRRVRLWHFRAASNPVVLSGHTAEEAWSLAFSPDGKTLASVGDDKCIRLWNPETGEERAVLRGHNSLVTSVAFAPDSKTLASASFDLKAPVALWDVATGTRKCVLSGHTGFGLSVCFGPNGRTLASGSRDRSAIIWNIDRRQREATFTQNDSARCLAVSPDGQTLGSSDGSDIILTDLGNQTRRTIHAGTSDIFSLVWSLDGAHLISGHQEGLITTWDVVTGRQTQTLPGHSGHVFGLALSPDGRTLASAGEDMTVRVWDVVTGQELLCLTDCKARVNAVAFSPDGHTLAAADHTGVITLWRVRPGR